MKQFFGAFFGSLIGIVIATLLALAVIIGVIKSSVGAALKTEPQETSTNKLKSLLHLKLSGEIKEREIENPLAELQELGGMNIEEGSGLNVLTKKINQAKTDDKIKGIYLEVGNLIGAYANITELRNALADFKKSGKFIYSYAEYYGQSEYYLASVADKVYLNPQGALDFRGLSMQILFYKKMFEKLGIDMQIFRHGKFKSAIEPFMLEKMSDANRTQSEAFLNSIWAKLTEDIAANRKLSVADLNNMANNLTINSVETALENKLVDELVYEDEVIATLKKKIGVDAKDKLNFITIDKYSIKSNFAANKSKIAVIFANGGISGGEGNDDEIGSERISRAIKEARLDEKVKAIVLRVNSPGGSAIASDIIWREVVLAKKSKPVVVSMGNYAASGGYYISCAATRIFAQPNTITGSIGVFGVIPNLQKALDDKLGITVDTVNTNKYSSMGTAILPMGTKESEHIQSSIEKIYDAFITKVAEGRGIEKSAVDSIGQGRVWSGSEAIEIKLVDELGGLNDAINYAVKKAGLTDYKIVEMPKPKNPFDKFLGKGESEIEARLIQKNLGPAYLYLKQIHTVLNLKGVQARLPFELLFE